MDPERLSLPIISTSSPRGAPTTTTTTPRRRHHGARPRVRGLWYLRRRRRQGPASPTPVTWAPCHRSDCTDDAALECTADQHDVGGHARTSRTASTSRPP